MKPTLFFDMDGTLIDSAVGITRCVAHALSQMNVAVPPSAEPAQIAGLTGGLTQRGGMVLRSIPKPSQTQSRGRRPPDTVCKGIGQGKTAVVLA